MSIWTILVSNLTALHDRDDQWYNSNQYAQIVCQLAWLWASQVPMSRRAPPPWCEIEVIWWDGRSAVWHNRQTFTPLSRQTHSQGRQTGHFAGQVLNFNYKTTRREVRWRENQQVRQKAGSMSNTNTSCKQIIIGNTHTIYSNNVQNKCILKIIIYRRDSILN